MKKYLIVFTALVVTLIIPFVLRPAEDRVETTEGSTLTIISPHVESIRMEFTRGFQRHMRENHSRNVEIQWLTPGGTSEIDKYVDTEYRAVFESHWKKTQMTDWRPVLANAVAMSKVPDDADPELKSAREVFLNSNLGMKADLFFGGGTHDFEKAKGKGYLVATDPTGKYGLAAIKKAHPDWFADTVIPQKFNGQSLYDPELCWVGNCLSTFGIVYNSDLLQRLSIDSPPRQWADLTHPNYAGYIALADPGKSGSAAMAFEMIIQQQIQIAVAQAKKRAAEPAPAQGQAPLQIAGEALPKTEEEAISYGWNRGLQLIQRIAANARYFTDSAPRPPQDVANGEAAAGMAIDFYGRTFVEKHQRADGTSRVVYHTPVGGSSVNADPIGMYRGAPNPELASLFMEFVLSLEGQRLWGYRTGTPGGPTRKALRRLPIYEPKYTKSTFNALRVIIRAMCLDTQEEMKSVWKELCDHGFPPRATQNFSDLRIISYEKVMGDLTRVFNGSDKIQQSRIARDLAGYFRNQYENAAELAKRGE
jgi:iron(III) transport system substrate-binding protein